VRWVVKGDATASPSGCIGIGQQLKVLPEQGGGTGMARRPRIAAVMTELRRGLGVPTCCLYRILEALGEAKR
jgi:hypothetical protein